MANNHPPWQKNMPLQNFQQQMNLQFNQQLNAAAAYGFQQQNFANLQSMGSMAANLQQIQYPPRVNAIAFQQQPASQPQNNQVQSSQSSNSKYNTNIKTFSGTGSVSK